MPRRDLTPYLLLGLGGAIALAFTQRKTIMLYGRKVVDAAHDAIFAAQLPSYARPYAPIILRVSREESVDPFLIFGLGDRESGWGRYLDANGLGDNERGHGLLQIDIGSFASWLRTHDWRDPYTNVKKGVQILKGKLAFFQGRSSVKDLTDGSTVVIGSKSAERLKVSPGAYRDPRPLTGTALWEAAIAAYNTGEGNVLKNLAVGRPAQFTTAGGDYVTDVSRRASNVATQYDRATV